MVQCVGWGAPGSCQQPRIIYLMGHGSAVKTLDKIKDALRRQGAVVQLFANGDVACVADRHMPSISFLLLATSDTSFNPRVQGFYPERAALAAASKAGCPIGICYSNRDEPAACYIDYNPALQILLKPPSEKNGGTTTLRNDELRIADLNSGTARIASTIIAYCR